MSTDAEYLVEGVPRPAGRHVCLPELLEQIRFRFDIKETSLRLTDAQVTYLINRAREKLFRLLVEYDDTRLRLQTDVVTEAGVSTVALPERTYAPVRLGYTDADGTPREIAVASARDTRLGPSSASWTERAPVYYTTALELVIVPTPATVQTLKLVYVASWPDMAPAPSDYACWDGVQPNWDEWVIWDVLVTLALRSRRPEDLALFKAERDEITAGIMNGQKQDQFEGPTFSRRILFRDGEDCG